MDVKEVSRQLNREQEKLRVSEVKLQELKEQQMNLNFLTHGGGAARRFTSPHRTGDGKKVPWTLYLYSVLKIFARKFKACI